MKKEGFRFARTGITLVALVITIIILLILAGITLGFVFKNNGIIELSQRAKQNYIEAENEESKQLDRLYSEMMVATDDDAKITISMKDLKSIISTQVQEELKNSEIANNPNLKIKTGTMLCNNIIPKDFSTYTIEFDTPMETANYNVIINVGGGNAWTYLTANAGGQTESGFKVSFYNHSSTTASSQMRWIAIPNND